jgi:hypothetical protein
MSENRELNAQVAEAVMGWRWFHCVASTGVERNQFCSSEQSETWRLTGWKLTPIPSPPPPDQFNDDSGRPDYSNFIGAAMEVVEKMGRRVDIQFFPGHIPQWRVMFINPTEEGAWAVTLPEAICRAALAAVKDQNGAEVK